jgi:hypothetical protein
MEERSDLAVTTFMRTRENTILKDPAHRLTAEVTEGNRLRSMEWASVSLLFAWTIGLQVVEWPALIYPTFDSNFYHDSAVFGLAGQLLRDGGIPHVSFWDHKPPLIHLINAVGLFLSGGHVWGIWMVGLTAMLSGLLVAYAAMRKLFGPAAAIFGVAFFAFGIHRGHGANVTELYALPLQFAATLILIQWRAADERDFSTGVLLGVLGGLAFLLRANLIGAMVSVGLVLTITLLWRWQFSSWLRFMAGGLSGVVLIILPLILYLWLRDAFYAFLDQAFHYNLIYSSKPWAIRVHAAFTGLQFSSLYAPLFIPIAGWLIAFSRLNPWGQDNYQWSIALFIVIWLPVEIVFASLAGRDYGHYFIPLLPPLSFLAAFLVSEIATYAEISFQRQRQQQYVIIAILVALAIVPIADAAAHVKDHGLPRQHMDDIAPVVDYVRCHTRPDESIFIWGHAAAVYFFSDRRPASRYIYPLPLLTPNYADAPLIQGFLTELEKSAPAIIIDATAGEDVVPPLDQWNPNWRFPSSGSEPSYWTMTPELKHFYDYVWDHYTVADTIGRLGWKVYRSRSSLPSTRMCRQVE